MTDSAARAKTHSRLRRIAAAGRLVVVALLMLISLVQMGIFYPLVSPDTRSTMFKRWARWLLAVLGVSVEFEPGVGGHQVDGGLVVCNHISFLDIFVISSVLPSIFVAKSTIASWPVLGWLAARTGTVFIERGSRTAAHRTHQRITDLLANGARIAIFPEGTTSSGSTVMPFHAALFQSAIDASAPLHCLSLSYHDATGARSEAPAYIGDLSLVACLLQIALTENLYARLRVLPADDHPRSNRRHLAHRAHHQIAGSLAAAHHGGPSGAMN